MAATLNLLITIPQAMLENEDIYSNLPYIFTQERLPDRGWWGSVITPDQLRGSSAKGSIVIGMKHHNESPMECITSWIDNVFNKAKLLLNYDDYRNFSEAFMEEILPYLSHFFYPEPNFRDIWDANVHKLKKYLTF